MDYHNDKYDIDGAVILFNANSKLTAILLSLKWVFIIVAWVFPNTNIKFDLIITSTTTVYTMYGKSVLAIL